MTLEEALKKAAYKVWDELEPIPKSPNYKIFEVREEALTTMLIKELYKASCNEISKVEMIPGSEETIKGYDFELVIGSKLKGKYIKLFVQGKRLYGKKTSDSYNAIDFEQTDTLIEYAKKNSGLAMYAFYNHLIDQEIKLQEHYNSATIFDKKSMGITISSAYSVKMLGTKRFSDYHFNGGKKMPPRIYSLRYFAHLFYFHKDLKRHLAVPFHELSYFTIEMAELINKLYRDIKAKSRLHFFFFFLPGFEKFFENSDEIIPVRKTNIKELVNDFKNRTSDIGKNNKNYRPEALIIIDTNDNTLTYLNNENE
jgi:hypothetical protein